MNEPTRKVRSRRYVTITDEEIRAMRADYQSGMTLDDMFVAARVRGTMVSFSYARLLVLGYNRKGVV